jgi:hypothetical protein
MDVLLLCMLASAGTCLPSRSLAMGLCITILWRRNCLDGCAGQLDMSDYTKDGAHTLDCDGVSSELHDSQSREAVRYGREPRGTRNQE